MEIRIGVTYTAKEISLELPEGASSASLKEAVDAALANESSVLWLEDKKGRQIGVPSDKVAYVEIGTEDDTRPIGFG